MEAYASELAQDNNSDHVVDDIRRQAGPDAKIVLISGDFNVIHPGHLRILRFAAEIGTFLVAVVNSDERGLSIVPATERLTCVEAVKDVDYAFILDEPVEVFISRLRPDYVVKGLEHHVGSNPEALAVKEYGGSLVFASGEAYFHDDYYEERFLQNSGRISLTQVSDYLHRHQFNGAELRKVVADFSKLRVVVIGDLIIDEYIDCIPVGLSREDPTIVVSPRNRELFFGGSGIVAAHVRSLGASVKYFTVVGDDEIADFSDEQAKQYDLDAEILRDGTRPTTLKQRWRADGKTLLRVSNFRQHAISDELIAEISEKIDRATQDADVIIFSDFNYGCLPQDLVDAVTASGVRYGLTMAADSQASSQLSDISRFKDMNLVTPTEYEARLAMKDEGSGLVQLAEDLRTKSNSKYLILTLGSDGCLIHGGLHTDDSRELPSDRLPALGQNVMDVSGAGDSLLAVTAMSLALTDDIWRSTCLGSIGAACQVSRKGNIPLTPSELLEFLD